MNKAGAMIQSWTHPRWMHTYALFFEPYQRLHHSRKSNHSAVQLIWVRCPDKIGSDCDKDQFTFGSQVFPQMLVSGCFRRLTGEQGFPTADSSICVSGCFLPRECYHMNMYNGLGNVQTTRCRRADVETFVMKFEYNVRLSSDESKHYNFRQPR